MQAEEERKRAEEEAAAKEAAKLAANPVLRIRKFIAGADSAANIAAELKTVDVQGGHIGRMRVLYEASHSCCHLIVFLRLFAPCLAISVLHILLMYVNAGVGDPKFCLAMAVPLYLGAIWKPA